MERGSTDWPDRLICMGMVKPGDELPGMVERIVSPRTSGWDP